VTDIPKPRVILSASDAWILAALTEEGHFRRAHHLKDLIHDMDWLNRQMPSFDELSFGLQRLVVAGLARAAGSENVLKIEPTTRAIELRIRVDHSARTLGGVLLEMERALVAEGLLQNGNEDRSHGRLQELSPVTFEQAMSEHSRWVNRWARPWLLAARVLRRILGQ
jgi:hypothetical protein